MKEIQKKIFHRNISEKGVSEAVGFLIIFSIVMIGISIITLYGYPMLLEQKSIANVRNVERDMIVIQNDMKSLAYKNVPYKETSLQVSGGALRVKSFASSTSVANSYFKIWNGTSTPLIEESFSGQLRFESDSTDDIIVLENGAVFTRQRFQTGSAMLAEPRWFFDDLTQTLVINLINISSADEPSKIGVMTIQMRGTFAQLYDIDITPPEKVYIRYKPDSNFTFDFSTAWRNYLENTLKMNPEPSEDDYTYSRDDVKRLVIKQYEVEILNI